MDEAKNESLPLAQWLVFLLSGNVKLLFCDKGNPILISHDQVQQPAHYYCGYNHYAHSGQQLLEAKLLGEYNESGDAGEEHRQHNGADHELSRA